MEKCREGETIARWEMERCWREAPQVSMRMRDECASMQTVSVHCERGCFDALCAQNGMHFAAAQSSDRIADAVLPRVGLDSQHAVQSLRGGRCREGGINARKKGIRKQDGRSKCERKKRMKSGGQKEEMYGGSTRNGRRKER